MPNSVKDLAEALGVGFGTSGVRGKVVDLTPELCHAYTHAFLEQTQRDSRKVLIGHDLRPSSPNIAAYCRQSALQSGYEVSYAGVLPTPALAFAAQELGIPAIMVTGSHIPFDRNGLKFYHAQGEITKADEARILAAPLPRIALENAGGLPEADSRIVDIYIRRYLDVFAANALSGWRIGVFEHSSAARDLLHRILRALGADTVSLERNNGFVAVDTEAVRQEDIDIAPVWAKSHSLDAIVTTDGDADRPLVADEQGIWLRGDILGILASREIGAQSVVTPVSSNTALEASGFFRNTVRTRIGSPYVIEAMNTCRHHPVTGYEANGGFLLGSTIAYGAGELKGLPTRDCLLPTLLTLSAAKRRGCKLSALLNSLPSRHTSSDRLQNVDISLCWALTAELEVNKELLCMLLAPNSGELETIDTTDGLRARFSNGDIVHVRLSGNAPELRCYAEASTKQQADELRTECLARLRPLVGRSL